MTWGKIFSSNTFSGVHCKTIKLVANYTKYKIEIMLLGFTIASALFQHFIKHASPHMIFIYA